MGGGVLLPHDRLDGVLALLHVLDGRQLLGNGLAGRELPPGFVLLAGGVLELAGGLPLLEVAAHLAVSQVAHAAPQGIAHDVSFVGDGFALKVTALCKSHCFLNSLRVSSQGLRSMTVCACSRF